MVPTQAPVANFTPLASGSSRIASTLSMTQQGLLIPVGVLVGVQRP
jgi:hypothetical protein